MEEINRLHDIADDIGGTSWGYQLADALHRIAAHIEEKVYEMRHVGEYEDDVLTFVEAYGGLEEVKEHMIPEGFRWPLFEDNEPVGLGDHWHEDGFDESITRIDSIEFAEDGVRFENEYADTFYRYGERVKRPAPKVLDADGVEIRVGDEVWATNGHGPFEVTRIVNADRLRVICDDEKNGHLNVFPESITHRAPVLAADGKPLREGDTVYMLDDDRPYTLKRFDGDHVYINAGGSSFDFWTFPRKLTNERPDSYEQLWMDMHPADETECVGLDRDEFVRRAKALAGVSE